MTMVSIPGPNGGVEASAEELRGELAMVRLLVGLVRGHPTWSRTHWTIVHTTGVRVAGPLCADHARTALDILTGVSWARGAEETLYDRTLPELSAARVLVDTCARVCGGRRGC